MLCFCIFSILIINWRLYLSSAAIASLSVSLFILSISALASAILSSTFLAFRANVANTAITATAIPAGPPKNANAVLKPVTAAVIAVVADVARPPAVMYAYKPGMLLVIRTTANNSTAVITASMLVANELNADVAN